MPPAIMPPADPNALAQQGMPNPFAQFAALQPPTSPSMGFQNWASDPQNAHKVVPSMTPPDAPLQPNAPQNNASALTPPAQAAPASVTPPVSQSQIAGDQAELQRLQQSGAAVNHIQNPFLRTLGKIGDIAAPFIIGGGAAAIPGTTLHNRYLQNQAQGRVNNDLASNQTAANTAQTQMQTAMAPVNAAYKQQKNLASLAEHGLKVQENEDGTTSIVPDENSPVYQQQQQKNELMDAQVKAAQANTELRNAEAAYNKAKTDPNSPLFKQTAERLAIARQNASAAGQRAQAYMGRYLQSAYNTGLNGEVLPGATQIADEGGNETVVGTGNASQAAKSQANVAQFNDIEGATNNIEKAATNLVNKGGKLNDPAVAAAIADPKTTAGQWAQGQFATSGLTPEQRDYVVQVKAYKENLQSLRKSAGGGVSDSQVDRLMALAPGASTPDLDYLKRQTEQIRQMRGRLAQGVTTAAGGVKVAGRSALNPPAAGPKAASGGPKEGDTKKNSSGDLVKFHNGAWGPA